MQIVCNLDLHPAYLLLSILGFFKMCDDAQKGIISVQFFAEKLKICFGIYVSVYFFFHFARLLTLSLQASS